MPTEMRRVMMRVLGERLAREVKIEEQKILAIRKMLTGR